MPSPLSVTRIRLTAAFFDIDGDLRGAGIERILHELLDDGSRPLDDFAGSDAIRDIVGKDSNLWHIRISRIECSRYWSSESEFPISLNC